MITFRKTLMATTMLVGLAIFATDAAQAGPNGGPSLGSISGFSSMRMDFNRVGGPNRALSRADMRVVPLEIKKSDKGARKDDKKSAAKKGADIARVSNPKSKSGGKGKEVASAPSLRIPAPIAELYRVTGGNLDDIAKLAELVGWLKTGLPALGSPLFDKGDGLFVPPTFGASDRLPWGDAENGSGNNTPQPIGNPNAQASGGGWVGWSRETTKRSENGVSYYTTRTTYRWINGDGSLSRSPSGDTEMTEESTSSSDGVVTSTVTFYGSDGATVVTNKITVTPSGDDTTSDQKSDEKPQPEKADSQPTEEGTGRPGGGMHTVRCDIAGCLDLGMKDGRRTNPGHGSTDGSGSADASGGGLPSWATDPCPDCGGRVSDGGGFHRPGGSDIGWRGHDGEGGGFNPLPAPH